MTALRTGNGFRNVVVTAVVSTNSLSTDAEDTWRRLLDGRSGIRALDQPFVDEYDLPVRIGGPIRESFDDQLNRVELRRLSYLQKMSTVLHRRLWDAAGFDDDLDTARLMVSISAALGTTEEAVAAYAGFVAKGMKAVSPLAIQMLMPNAPAAAVGIERKAKASVISPLMGDASGATAIGDAWRHLVLGEADVAICGGIDTFIGPITLAAFANSDLLSTRNDDPAAACRPFDADRDGAVFSEGGALMVLESEEHAVARGAPILGRVMGAAFSSDSHDPIAHEPSGESAAYAVARAVEYAGLQPTDIGLVTADATGTRDGDFAEARALARVFDDHSPAVYAPKAALGHAWGAAGAINAVLTVQALRDGVVPPTLNLRTKDVDLDVVAGEPRRGDYRYAVSDCFGFGGHNVALVFGAP